MWIFLFVIYILSLLLSLFTLFKDSKATRLGFCYWDALIALIISVIPFINTVVAYLGVLYYFSIIFKPFKIVYYKIDSFMSKDVFWRK